MVARCLALMLLSTAFLGCTATTIPTSPTTQAGATPAGTPPGDLAGHPATTVPADRLRVMAVTSFLADVTRNVAGDRATVTALVPLGMDPHAFEPTPADLRQVAAADLLVVNGGGFEDYLADLMASTSAGTAVIEAAAGLVPRVRRPGEPASAADNDHGAGEQGSHEAEGEDGDHAHTQGDPHFWMDPILAMDYVATIRDGLSRADPAGAAIFAANAEAYQQRLGDLDAEIRLLLSGIPEADRLLVTNHESLGYFADRYGFRIVGTVIPGASTGASPSARQMAELVQAIRRSGAKAIFLETGSNPQLARQVATETGIAVATDLYTHSLSPPEGPAASYLDMMRANARSIAAALGGP